MDQAFDRMFECCKSSRSTSKERPAMPYQCPHRFASYSVVCCSLFRLLKAMEFAVGAEAVAKTASKGPIVQYILSRYFPGCGLFLNNKRPQSIPPNLFDIRRTTNPCPSILVLISTWSRNEQKRDGNYGQLSG